MSEHEKLLASATPQAVRLGDLPALLPGYDLSRFTGDPDSLVYLAQATVPLAAIGMSEPGTWALLALGALALLVHENRRRKLRRPILTA